MAEQPKSPRNRTPTAVVNEIDDAWVSVKLVVMGIQPVMFGDKQKSKNGTVDVKFEPGSFAMSARVESPKGSFTGYKYKVKQLPTEIDPQQSTWKVKKDQVSLKLRKAVPDTWVPHLSGGLDQASDSEDEEQSKELVSKEVGKP